MGKSSDGEHVEIAEWFNSDLSDELNVPKIGTFKKSSELIGFGLPDFEKQFCRLFEYKNNTDLFDIHKFVPSGQKTDLTNLDKINKKLKENPEGKQLKSLQTRKKNLEKITESITKTVQVHIQPSNKQNAVLKIWMNETIKVYNKCVDFYNEDNTFFNKGYKKAKIEVFKSIYYGDSKLAPYDILTDEVRKFCSNLKSCRENKKVGHIRHFTMSHINPQKSAHTFFIPKSSISNGGFYKSHLGKMKGMEDVDSAARDCTITFLKRKNKYILNMPISDDRQTVKNRESICGIDEGEVYFVSYHGENTFGNIGMYMRQIILKKLAIISILQKILTKKKNKNGSKIRNRTKIKKRIQRIYDYIKHIVKELHNKTALFLVKSFDKILLPKFETQQMLMKKKYTKSYYQKIKKNEGEEKMKEEIRNSTRRKRLNKKVKSVLNLLSHYKFKQHLINKGNEYGCVVDTEVDESFTTKVCTFCGIPSNNITDRTKKCTSCGIKINRDDNGARNVLIKNVKKEEIKR